MEFRILSRCIGLTDIARLSWTTSETLESCTTNYCVELSNECLSYNTSNTAFHHRLIVQWPFQAPTTSLTLFVLTSGNFSFSDPVVEYDMIPSMAHRPNIDNSPVRSGFGKYGYKYGCEGSSVTSPLRSFSAESYTMVNLSPTSCQPCLGGQDCFAHLPVASSAY